MPRGVPHKRKPMPKNVRDFLAPKRIKYSPELSTKYCSLIATGMTTKAASAFVSMPSVPTVFEWLATYPEFAEAYAHAREARAEVWAAQALEIAQKIPEHVVDRRTGRTVVDNGAVQKAKLTVDTLKWLLVKLHPKQYGEVQQLRHAGADGGPIVIARNHALETLSDEQLDRLVALADAGTEAGEAEGLAAVLDSDGDAGKAGPAGQGGEKPT